MTCWSSSRSRNAWKIGRDAAQLQRVRAEEHQVVQHPVQLGEQRTRPHRALGDLHAEHPLDGQDDAQLVGERRQPVVAVGEHDDLAVVARLEELLGAAVHIADHRLGVLDALAVQDEPQPQHAVRGGVLRADVEHHVGALRRAADADRRLRHGNSVALCSATPGPESWTPGRAQARPGPQSAARAGPTGCSSQPKSPRPAAPVSSAASPGRAEGAHVRRPGRSRPGRAAGAARDAQGAQRLALGQQLRRRPARTRPAPRAP